VEPFVVAPFWHDLELTSESGVYWQVVGDAPERVLVVQWDHLRTFGMPGTETTFQAQIHQTGAIKFEYRTLNWAPLSYSPPVVGARWDATHVLQAANLPTSDTGLTFFGPVSVPHVAPTAPDAMGGWVKVGDGYLQMNFVPTLILPNQIRLTEVMFNPLAPYAATGEWFEVYNMTSAPYDIAGWTIDFGNGVTHLIDPANGLTVIPPKGMLVMGQTTNPAQNDNAHVQYAYGTTATMDDVAGSLSLTKGAPIATISWSAGVGGPGISMNSDLSAALYASGATGSNNCSSSRTYGSLTPPQRGSPGAPEGCFPYSLSSIPGNFEDISAAGTALLVGTTYDYTGHTTVTLPAPFTYFGTSYTTMDVSMVGFTVFGSVLTSAYDTTNSTVPSTSAPTGVVAPFWDQIVRNTGGKLLMQRMTPPGGLPYTIISWQNFRIYAESTTAVHNFQEKLFDDGSIEFHYGLMDPGTYAPARSTGSSATVWIEKPDGTAALPVSINTANGIQPNSGWRFTPN
jgi:hypothetical protein